MYLLLKLTCRTRKSSQIILTFLTPCNLCWRAQAVKEPCKVHTKGAKRDFYNYLEFLRADSLAGGWKANINTKIKNYWFCLKTDKSSLRLKGRLSSKNLKLTSCYWDFLAVLNLKKWVCNHFSYKIRLLWKLQ